MQNNESFAELVKQQGIRLPTETTKPSAPLSHVPSSPLLPATVPSNCDNYAEKNSFKRDDFSQENLQKLKKKTPRAKIDLHGMTTEEAKATLEDELRQALLKQRYVVEVVHGRGSHSVDGRGVLRGLTRYCLSHCRVVLAYVELVGNPGAVLVQLRKRCR